MMQTSLNNVSIRLKSGGHSFSTATFGAEVRCAESPVVVSLLTPKTMLVPAEFFDAKRAEDYLAEVGLALSMNECAVCSNAVSGVVAVMAISEQCYAELQKAVPAGVCFTSPLLEGEAVEKGSIIHLEDNVLYVRVYNGGMLFAEAMECQSDADVLYYLAKIDKAYGIYDMYARAKGDAKRLKSLLKSMFKDLVCE